MDRSTSTSTAAGVDASAGANRASGDSVLAHYRASGELASARKLLEENPAVSFAGFHGAALPFFLAALLEGPDVPSLITTATQEEAEELREELETFSGRPALFFPPWESLFQETSEPDDDIFHERLRVLRELASPDATGSFDVVAPVHALLQPVPAADSLAAFDYPILRGADLPRDTLASKLVEVDFRHVPLVLRRGEFSVRGDIVDLFPFDAVRPLRVEFFGDAVESIREFDPESQRSVAGGELERRVIPLAPVKAMFRSLTRGDEPILIDHFPPSSRLVLVEPESIRERSETIAHNLLGGSGEVALLEAFRKRLDGRPCMRVYSLAMGKEAGSPAMHLGFGSVERFQGNELGALMGHVSEALAAGTAMTVYCDSDAERRRIEEILGDHHLDPRGSIELVVGPVRRGFESRAIGAVVLSTRELFRRRVVRRAKRLPAETRAVHGFFELEDGDLVVHLTHGIGRYLGVRQMEKDGVVQEFLVLEYRNGVKVHVPASKIDLVQKYIGTGSRAPTLDRVGGSSWNRRKESVEQAIVDFASELLEIQALRQQKAGNAYPPDDDWQRQFEAAFPFEDTPDQFQATEGMKTDLEAARPMDRLICGDVGYGKTEVAMRGTFKVVNAGRQVAVLVPTTVLAQQHCRTFRERMAGFPIRIEQLSRFCTPREQREIVEETCRGNVDVLIGTHRLLSDDVGFRDLGLVIIDEEQRFGVGHKEKLKRMRALVDFLTLTATPIPRTLHMSLLGIRDISSLTTPPEGRSPISTRVIQFERHTIREAIIRELNREGQVYFVHNRVQDIGLIRHQLQQIVPEAVSESAHGQMSEHELEDIMIRFLDRQIDVLVSTTIIETGIDIPNVNTIFINECDRYGLADLHQLRGRVGRSRHKAYCYLILPEHRHVNPDARKRLQTIQEFSHLGAGFQIAMRDLEIRGAGNILGAQQSGHIAVVGYDLYCRLLEKAVKKIEGKELDKAVDVQLELNVEAYIPAEMVKDESSRLEIYRRISAAQEPEILDDLATEIEDRHGKLVPPVRRLLDVQLLRVLAARHGIREIGQDEGSIVLRCSEKMRPLLDACPHRVVVLDPARVAVVINDLRGGRRREVNDEFVFSTMLRWLRTGRFPRR